MQIFFLQKRLSAQINGEDYRLVHDLRGEPIDSPVPTPLQSTHRLVIWRILLNWCLLLNGRIPLNRRLLLTTQIPFR